MGCGPRRHYKLELLDGAGGRWCSVLLGWGGRWWAVLGGRLGLLLLILDEVDLWLAGLCGLWSGQDDGLLLLGLLDQNIHKGLVLILDRRREHLAHRGRRVGRLDEDDLVVLLGNGRLDGRRGRIELWLLWRHMHVHVLGHERLRGGWWSVEGGWWSVNG